MITNEELLILKEKVQGKRAITAHTAIRLARYLGTSPEIWVTMQARYDLAVAQHALGAQIEKEVRVFKAA
jgi:plasmid maintenance system antidote protein VapI